MKTILTALLALAFLALFHAAATAQEAPKPAAPTIEQITAERDALRAEVVRLQLLAQAFKEQRDDARSQLADADAQLAIEQFKAKAAQQAQAKK